jgi:hypothetical protein
LLVALGKDKGKRLVFDFTLKPLYPREKSSHFPFSRSGSWMPHRWCLHLIVVVGFECSRDPESYAGGSVATGRSTHAGQVKG